MLDSDWSTTWTSRGCEHETEMTTCQNGDTEEDHEEIDVAGADAHVQPDTMVILPLDMNLTHLYCDWSIAAVFLLVNSPCTSCPQSPDSL